MSEATDRWAALRALSKESTPRPWKSRSKADPPYLLNTNATLFIHSYHPRKDGDAAFAEAAINACDDLLAERDRYRTALETLKAHLEYDDGATCDIATMYRVVFLGLGLRAVK
jgi:hypothetical protein